VSIYQIDNSRDTKAYFERIKATGIDVTHLAPWSDWDRTFFKAWELILRRAQDLDCKWCLSLEADNIVGPEALEVMVNIALYGNLHLVTHDYPLHDSAAKASGVSPTSWYYRELGVMLLSRQLLERAISEFEEFGNIAAAIFGCCTRYHGGQCNLTCKFRSEHRSGYHQSYQNLGPSECVGLMMPTPQMPSDYGSELPPCLRESAA